MPDVWPAVGVAAVVALTGPWAVSAQESNPPQYITAPEAIAWAPLPYDARIQYGPEELQFGELRLPEGPGPHPVAVVMHGGCWLSIANNDYMDPVAVALTDAGWATWNLEFRRIDQPGGSWPGIFLDVARGVDKLRDLATGFDLDLGHVVTVGHSSGGHLALWAASRHRISTDSDLHTADPLPVHGAVSLAGIADLEHYAIMEVPACGDTPSRLLGGEDPAASRRTANASPAALLPTGVPQLLLTGDVDYAVPPAHGDAYEVFARAHGQTSVHHRIANSSHFEIVAPWTGAWQHAWALIGPFLSEILTPTAH